MRKIFSILTITALLCGTVFSGEIYSKFTPSFKLQHFGIMVGEPDGNFRPWDDVTRAEMAKIICTTHGLKDYPQTATAFSDVPQEHWASGFIFAATDRGIINGFEDGTFRPQETVTFAQAVKMVVCMLGYNRGEQLKYPERHLELAAQLELIGLADGISVTPPDSLQLRANINTLVDNALYVPIVEKNINDEYVIMDGSNGTTEMTLLTMCHGVPNVLFQYFDAFENADYETMKKYSTEEHIKTYFHEDDVFGNVWAKLAGLDDFAITRYRTMPGSVNDALEDGEMAFFVDVEMESTPVSALYPSVETSLYVILKFDNGFYKVDRFATSL